MGALLLTSAYTLLAAVSYVGCMYYFHPPQGARDDLRVVRSRIRRVSAVTLANIVLAPIVMSKVIGSSASFLEAWDYMGLPFRISTIPEMARTVLLFAGLFIGPIVARTVRDFDQDSYQEERVDWSIYSFRDYVFAPVTEELIFTAVATGMYAPFVETDASLQSKVTYLTPLLFGVAHLHHGVEMFRENVPLKRVLLTVAFQLLYTTLFGVMTNKIFFNSGSVWCCIAAHSFCNCMGFPRLSVNTTQWYKKYTYWALLLFGLWFFRTRFDALSTPH